MTFSYSPFTANKDKVRYHLGDTDSTQAWFTDEEIVAIIALEGTWQKAVISCLNNMIARLSSEPTMQADWLKTDYATAIKALNDLLKRKANEFGLPSGRTVTGSIVQTYRPDSDQTEAMDYDA